MNAASRGRPSLRILPAWLWFWLGLYVLTLPAQIRSAWQPALVDLLVVQPHPGEALIPFSVFFRLANLAELAPLLLVALGVISVALPWLRARWLERRYRLGPPAELPIIMEMQSLLADWAPNLEMRCNLLRTDQLAFVYPLSYRRSAVAIFGGLVKLWRRDPRAGQAVLLHEVAHYRQGDTLVVGYGSFFETMLRFWLPLFVAVVLLPLSLVWGFEAVRFLIAAAPFGGLPQALLSKIIQLATIYLPGMLLIFTGLLLWTLSVLILPLVGIWCAELNADRLAIRAAVSQGALLPGLGLLQAGPSRWRWLLAWSTHPPARLRRRLVSHSAPESTPLTLIGLFPLAFILRPFLLAGWALTGLVLIGSSPQAIGANLAGNLRTFFAGAWPVFGAMALLVLFWPLLAGLWGWFFCQLPFQLDGRRPAGLLAGAALLAALAAGSFWLSRLPAQVSNQPEIEWQTGQQIMVEWQGEWYPAEILKRAGGRYLVHYLGYDSSWDEWVEPARMRTAGP